MKHAKARGRKLLCLALSLLILAGSFTACTIPEEEKNAYEIAVEQGFEGSLEDWIASLQGEMQWRNLGNQFDNTFDKTGCLDPYTGEEKLSINLKYSSAYYAFSAGNLFFEATKSAPTLVFVFYNESKEYMGYQSFSDMTQGICGWGCDGYFRCYVDKDFDGQIYFSSNVPKDPVDYSCTLSYVPVQQERKLTIVNLGDSIFGETQNGTSVSATLQSFRGDTVYNFGFGGTMMSTHPSAGWEQFSFYALVDAICTGDYAGQWAQLNSDTYFPSYFHTTIKAMQAVDWNKVDVITVAFGTNDYHNKSGTLFGEPTDMSAYTGAFEYGVQKLQQTYPHIRIIAITPVMRLVDNRINADEHNENGNGTLRDYATALGDTAQRLRVPVIDAFTELPLSQFNKEYYYQTNDGTHLNARGRRMFAGLINGYLDLYCGDLTQAPISRFEGN